MKPEKKISLLFLSMALLMTAACTKDDTPAEEKTPVGFRAMSQLVVSKSGDNSFPHDNFGVWGIATEALNDPYVLWSEDALALVNRVDRTETFAPHADAYWLTGYKYYFLAIAPYNSGVTNLNISKTYTAGHQLAAYPTMSFTYDLNNKYNPGTDKQPEFAFDLLAAAQYKDISTPSQKPVAQDLIFWHLFSKIVIDVTFVGDDTKPLTGTNLPAIKKMRLCNVKTKSDYELSYSETASNNISLIPSISKYTNPEDQTNYVAPVNLEFTSSHQDLHIVPQNISGFKLYVDFEMNTAKGRAEFKDFEINLFPKEETPKEYLYNNQYNWNITISPKADVFFTVTVTPWVDGGTILDTDII